MVALITDHFPEIWGIERLFTEASELARRFFLRKGFTALERQDKVLRGVPIHNYRMAKTLG